MNPLQIALHEFTNALAVTGGVIQQKNGLYSPIADPDWIDIGEAYINACHALQIEPIIAEGA